MMFSNCRILRDNNPLPEELGASVAASSAGTPSTSDGSGHASSAETGTVEAAAEIAPSKKAVDDRTEVETAATAKPPVDDAIAEPEHVLDPEARFRLLYAQLVRDRKTEDGGESADELEKLSETLSEQGLDVQALVQEIESAAKTTHAATPSGSAATGAALAPDSDTAGAEEEGTAPGNTAEEAAPPCNDAAASPEEEDAPPGHTAEAAAPSRSRTPERAADGKMLKEAAPPARGRTPERGADGRTLKEDAAPARSRTPERTGSGGSKLQLVHNSATSTTRAKVVENFEAIEGEGTISIAIGDVVRVISATDDEWWEGHIEGRSHVDDIGYFPAAFVEVIDDSPGSAEPRTVKAKQKYKPPPPKLEPWEDPESAEYDPLRVQANAAFRQQHADGANAPKTKKQKAQAAIEKKQAEEKALKAAEAEFSAEQTAQLEQLEAKQKRLFAEYQSAFAEGSGMSKAQIQAASKAYAAAQAEAKTYRQAAVTAVRQRTSSGASDSDRTVERTTATGNRAGVAPKPLQPTGGAAKKVDVKAYLAERGLSEWYRPLSLHGSIIRVSQLESITERCGHLLLPFDHSDGRDIRLFADSPRAAYLQETDAGCAEGEKAAERCRGEAASGALQILSTSCTNLSNTTFSYGFCIRVGSRLRFRGVLHFMYLSYATLFVNHHTSMPYRAQRQHERHCWHSGDTLLWWRCFALALSARGHLGEDALHNVMCASVHRATNRAGPQ